MLAGLAAAIIVIALQLTDGPDYVFRRLRSRILRSRPRSRFAASLKDLATCPYCLGLWATLPLWVYEQSFQGWSWRSPLLLLADVTIAGVMAHWAS